MCPNEGRAYRNELDKARWGALRVHRIERYKGLILRALGG